MNGSSWSKMHSEIQTNCVLEKQEDDEGNAEGNYVKYELCSDES